MSRLVGAAFAVSLLTFFGGLPVVALSYRDVLPRAWFGDAVSLAILAALATQFVGVVYLARVPAEPWRSRHAPPERPTGGLDPRSLRHFVRITVSTLAVATLVAAVVGCIVLLRMIGS